MSSEEYWSPRTSDQFVFVRQTTPLFEIFFQPVWATSEMQDLPVLTLLDMQWEEVLYQLTFKVHVVSHHKPMITLVYFSAPLNPPSLLSFFLTEMAPHIPHATFLLHKWKQKYEIRAFFFFIYKRLCTFILSSYRWRNGLRKTNNNHG